ncbi:MAG: hypothetical protein AAGK02_01330 [Pseudomonadota bacterium]
MRLVIGIADRSTPRRSVLLAVPDQRRILGFRELLPTGVSGDEPSIVDVSDARERFDEAGGDSIAVVGERRSWSTWVHLANAPNVDGLLIYDDPANYIAQRLFEGEDIDTAADTWIGAASLVLNAADAAADSTKVVNGLDIAVAPDEFTYFCETHFGVPVQARSALAPTLEHVIAAHYVACREDLRTLADELAARSDVIGQADLYVRTLSNLALREFAALTERAKKFDDAEHDLELSTKQLELVQFKAETYYKRLSKADESSARNAELVRVSADLEHARHEIAALKSSTSWRFSAPVRMIARAIRLRTNVRSLVSERRQLALVEQSGLFDADWYQQKYPDVGKSRIAPALHFLRFGGQEGRSPSEKFNSMQYLTSNPDVAADGINPLVHYIKYGRSEARATGL